MYFYNLTCTGAHTHAISAVEPDHPWSSTQGQSSTYRSALESLQRSWRTQTRSTEKFALHLPLVAQCSTGTLRLRLVRGGGLSSNYPTLTANCWNPTAQVLRWQSPAPGDESLQTSFQEIMNSHWFFFIFFLTVIRGHITQHIYSSLNFQMKTLILKWSSYLFSWMELLSWNTTYDARIGILIWPGPSV